MCNTDIDTMIAMREALEAEFAEEFAAQSEGMNRGQAFRLKHKLKDTEKFQRLNCLYNPLKEAFINDIQSLYSDFYFPKQWLEFLRFSNGLFYSSIGNNKRYGFAKSNLWISGMVNTDTRKRQLDGIYLREEYPIDYQKVLIIGKAGCSLLGVWLNEDPQEENEIVLFNRPTLKNNYNPQEFQVIFKNIPEFIAFLAQGVVNNEKLDLRFNKEAEHYSFTSAHQFPEKWRYTSGSNIDRIPTSIWKK